MLFKLSIKNIQKSIKDYAIYFLTLVLGVAIFYVFNSIESQTVMMKVSSNTLEIINLMNQLLSSVSVFISFILGFLIIYASRFLIKRRNKEFGIYLTLGMSKRKISLILFFETLIIGILSLGVGLLIGFFLSELMSLLVANLFEADMTNFRFIFSSSAALKCLIYFGIMYLIVMIFNTISVSKCKLIDLINSSKKTEKIKLKNPILCVIIFIIACVMLIYSYYFVTSDSKLSGDVTSLYIPIVLGALSTFLIFWSLSGLILKIVMNMKGLYYKGLNSFTLRQVSSKINTTVFSSTIICLMLFITICFLSSCLSIKNSLTGNIDELSKVDVEIIKDRNVTDDFIKDYELNDEIIADTKIDILETLKNNNIDKNNFKDMLIVYYYKTNLTLQDTLGDAYEEVKEKFPLMNFFVKENIMSISDYNKVAKLYGNKIYTLKENEYIVIADYNSMIDIRNKALNKNSKVTVNDNVLTPKYSECKYGFVDVGAQHLNSGIIVVPDNVVNENMPKKEILLANYNANTKVEKQKINSLINNLENTYNKTNLVSYNTKIDMLESSIGLGALVTFIGLYLGIIFLISSAAILALKELSESTDNKERYKMIRKLGADEKMINKALFNQIFIFFMIPLLLAIVHSIFGIKFAKKILGTMGISGLTSSITMTFIFLVLIYGGYFLLTYFASKNIIRER
ncbi:MAG TPA: ABC transporter permease [Firmicutes bacterium]|nr:ABC transporter permease [Bacillota bacterium]